MSTYHNHSLGSVASELLDLGSNALVIVGRDVDEVLGSGVENNILLSRCIDTNHTVSQYFDSEAHSHRAESAAGPSDDNPVSTVGSGLPQSRVGCDSCTCSVPSQIKVGSGGAGVGVRTCTQHRCGQVARKRLRHRCYIATDSVSTLLSPSRARNLGCPRAYLAGPITYCWNVPGVKYPLIFYRPPPVSDGHCSP